MKKTTVGGSMARHFGNIDDIQAGTTFESRRDLHEAGIHAPTQAGISGSAADGCDSIVVSGGYEDDDDCGDEIIYTGHGGNDPESKKQIEDQTWTRGNLALVRSQNLGLPIRVVRGSHPDSEYAPLSGYRYDGLYRVDEHWQEDGKSGFTICRFRLVKTSDDSPGSEDDSSSDPAGNKGPSRRVETTTLRIIRDTKIGRAVKELHGYKCQICGTRLEGIGGGYAEASHIKPLGAPHNGPDSTDNILCLCPNHHWLLDNGAITINDDMTLNGVDAGLATDPRHIINVEYTGYHRQLFPEPKGASK